MLLYAWMDIHTNKNIQKYTHNIWTTTYCCMRNWVFLCFLFLIWLNFKSISASSTHGLNAVRKLKRQQETRMSQCKRTTNCLALHLQLKYKCPIKGSFHFSFVCTCTGGEGKKKSNICLQLQKLLQMQFQFLFPADKEFLKLFLTYSLRILNCFQKNKTEE